MAALQVSLPVQYIIAYAMNDAPDEILSFGEARCIILEVNREEAELMEMCRKKGIFVEDVMGVRNASYRCQKLTVRIALSHLLSAGFRLEHTESGAPVIAGVRYLSISHCSDVVAVAVSESEPVGIDIETPSPRVLRVRERFLSDRESGIVKADDVSANLVAWTAKEALFKAIPHEGIDFREHLHLRFSDDGAVCSAWESRTGENQEFAINSVITRKYIMTIVTKIE